MELADAIQQRVIQAEQREAIVDSVLTFYLPLPAVIQQVAPQCIAFLQKHADVQLRIRNW